MATDNEITNDLLREIDEWLDDFADGVFEKSQRRLIAEDKVDTANLLQTANLERKKLFKSIIYPAPYADVVHWGRAPGTMPPVEPLIAWARRRGLEEPEKAAWAIAKAIKARGIKELPYLYEAYLDEIAEQEAKPT